jgi:hypothetical protein
MAALCAVAYVDLQRGWEGSSELNAAALAASFHCELYDV